MKLIDTDILIDHFHGNHDALDFIASELAAGEVLAISVVNLSEILSGSRPGEEERTERLIALFKVLEVDQQIGRKAGDYLRRFHISHNLELGDALVAATANLHGSELATRNLKHYPMDDIRVSSPYQRGL
jgi:predicted nucleic acid-binding protein